MVSCTAASSLYSPRSGFPVQSRGSSLLLPFTMPGSVAMSEHHPHWNYVEHRRATLLQLSLKFLLLGLCRNLDACNVAPNMNPALGIAFPDPRRDRATAAFGLNLGDGAGVGEREFHSSAPLLP